MRYVFLLLALLLIPASALEVEVLEVNGSQATVGIDQIDVGVSGFIVHKLDKDRHFIVNSAVVTAFDPAKKRPRSNSRNTPFLQTTISPHSNSPHKKGIRLFWHTHTAEDYS